MQPIFPTETEVFSAHVENEKHPYYNQFLSLQNQLKNIKTNQKPLPLKGFDVNVPLTSRIIGGSSKVSAKTVPKNELISFKLSLEYLYFLSVNLAVRQELKYSPLKLTLIGDSLCATSLFLFDTPKKSLLQASILNICNDLMGKILQNLPHSFINISFAVGELNSSDLNSKINMTPIKALNSSAWRNGSVLNFNSLTSHGILLYQKTTKSEFKMKIPSALVQKKEAKDPISAIFFSEEEPPCSCHQVDCCVMQTRAALKKKNLHIQNTDKSHLQEKVGNLNEPSVKPSNAASDPGPSNCSIQKKKNKLHAILKKISPAIYSSPNKSQEFTYSTPLDLSLKPRSQENISKTISPSASALPKITIATERSKIVDLNKHSQLRDQNTSLNRNPACKLAPTKQPHAPSNSGNKKAKTTDQSTSNVEKGEPSKNPFKNKKIVVTKSILEGKKTNSYDLRNYPPPEQRQIPIVITDPTDDNLMRKAVYGKSKGQFLIDNKENDPVEIQIFFNHKFRLIKNFLQINHESSLLARTPTNLALSPQIFHKLINSCFSPGILVFRLASMLLFIKKIIDRLQVKDKNKHLGLSNQINPFHLRELAWTLILKASTKYFPPQIPQLAEIEYLNTVPVLVNRLENAQLNLRISIIPIISNQSPLLNTLIREVHHHKRLRPFMGCRTVLSQTASLKHGFCFVNNFHHRKLKNLHIV